MEKPKVDILFAERKRTVSLHLLTQYVSDDILEQKEYVRNSRRNLNSNEDQPTELSRQATDKRESSTLDTGCFLGWADSLLTETDQKKNFEVECQARVFRS